MWRSSKFCAMFCLLVLVAACTGNGPREIQGTTLGTRYSLLLACTFDVARARDIAESAFERVDASMSTYRTDSELMELNRGEPFKWLAISQDFATVIAASHDISQFTDGAFDPTIGALVGLWGFGAAAVPEAAPAEAEIAPLRVASGWRGLELDTAGPRVRRRSDFALDLSAIAKGYAVDLAIAGLEAEGCGDLLLEVGGEVGVRGTRPGGGHWVLGIESPENIGGIAQAVSLSDASIATSGDYRNQLRIGDAFYSHTLDPETGRPVTHNVASVSVVASSTMRADALATALSVMGPVRGRAFAETHEIDAYFILRTESGYDSFATGRFLSLLLTP